MGDPRRARKKYMGPMHPWQKERIETELALKREYGLKNKKEIWTQSTILKKYIANFKKPVTSNQAALEREQLIEKLTGLGVLKPGAAAGEVLALTVREILERRLQTIVFRKGFARSMKQARQFITHRHIIVDGKVVTSPAYLVSLKEQGSIQFVVRSALADDQHPERAIKEQQELAAIKSGEKQAEVEAEVEAIVKDAPAPEQQAPKAEEVKTETPAEAPAQEQKVKADE